jgi:hypothetical protein
LAEPERALSRTAPLRMTDGSFVDHLDPGRVECGDQLDQ